jgi:hypothetical protein
MRPTTDERRSTLGAVEPSPRRTTRTAARVVGLVLAVATLLAAGLLAATAGVVHHLDSEHRHGGYLTTDTAQVSSEGHAVVFEDIDLDGLSGDWLLGTARVRATGADPASAVFVGVARSADVESYLRGAAFSTVTDIEDGEVTYEQHAGTSPTVSPEDSDIWSASDGGGGTRGVTWKPEDGTWTVVVMNQDASSGVDAEADVGATVPILPRVVRWLVISSAASGVLGLGIVVLALRRRQVSRR